MKMSWVVGLAMCAAAGCDSSSVDFEELLEDHRGTISSEIQDCGSVTRDFSCRTEVSAQEQCLVDAFTACTAAEMRLQVSTDEGDPIIYVYFIDPNGTGGCAVTVFNDVSRDAFKGNYGDYSQARCATVQSNPGDGTNTCAVLTSDDCEVLESWN